MAAAAAKKSSTDLTQGNIAKLILAFTIPIFVGQVFQNLYNSVDAIVVGQFVGTTALAAVTSCSDISMLLSGFFTGLSTGAGVLFSRYFGAKDYKNLHDSIHTALTFSLILGVIMATIGIIITPLLLDVVDCPPNVRAEADTYLRVYLIGILFTALYNVGAGVLRAVGDSKSPFYYLVIASILNIILDIVTVTMFGMGVMGVALATIIAQGASVLLVFGKMLRTTDVYRLILKDLKINKGLLLQVIRLGIPSAIQASLISVSNLFVQRYINEFGASAMAGIGAAKKIDKFAGIASQSIGLSVTTFVSQNIGADRKDRAFSGIRTALIIGFISVLAVGAPIFIFADLFVNIFSTDPEAVSYGVGMIRTMIPLYFCMTINQVYSNAVRGFGKSTMVMIFSLAGMIGCRQVWLAISMGINHSPVNIYIGYPLGWFCSALFVFVYYWFTIRKPYRRELAEQSPTPKAA